MFLKAIPKKDAASGQIYTYYRLCESFRIDNKPRHRNILSLGKLEELHTNEQRKQLADRIEQLYKDTPQLFPCDALVEKLAIHFVTQLRSHYTFGQQTEMIREATQPTDFDTIDLSSIKHEQVRELGTEWLCMQAAAQLKLAEILMTNGFSKEQTDLAITQIISRATYPASELKTQNWIQDNSSVSLLNNIEPQYISRHKLYVSALSLYDAKEAIETHLDTTTHDLFELDDKICLFDLTNTYFEGRKVQSEMAQFGRSKEKRSDCKLIVLALVTGPDGFVKMSKLYKGNTADCTTLEYIISHLYRKNKPVGSGKKPVVAIDAGIATNENLTWLQDNGYDYICVSRVKLKDYTLEKTDPVIITDNRNHPIELNIVTQPAENGDRLLYVHSNRKEQKEQSMDVRASLHLETELSSLHTGLAKKGTVKKYDSILTRLGRIQERNKAVSRFYDIIVEQKDGKATGVIWKKKEDENKQTDHGIYFLRTSLQGRDEQTLWTLYNTLAEIEASFRILKTDLQIRPVFHINDKSTEAHIFLGIVAYSLVATIRYQLKLKNIHYDWREIVRKMSTQHLITSTMKNSQGQTIIIQQPSEPTAVAKEIYTALNYKPKPYSRKKSVLPEL